jgi:thiol-disulfide isomerase/thioredoxin
VLLACSQGVFAEPVKTIVRGTVHNAGTQSIALFKVENGEPVKIGFRWPAKDGSFSFDIPLENESIFFVAKAATPLDVLKNVLYLKPGVIIQLNVYSGKLAYDFDSCIIDNVNPETILLQQWTDLFNPLCNAGRNMQKRENFFEIYNQFIEKAEAFKNSIHTSNNYFNQLMKLKVDIDLDFARTAAFFYFGSRVNSSYDTSMAHRSFYNPVLQKGKYCDALLLNTDHGMELLRFYISVHRFFESKNIKEFQQASFKTPFVEPVCNDTLKGALVLSYLQRVMTGEDLVAIIQPYEKYFLTPSLKEIYDNKKKELMPFATGADAYNFSLPDISDKNVSLKDFKGKVVVLDMWAMWCGPCLKEKPYFRKIEEEYKSNNQIVFLSVSTDGAGKKEVWKNFVKKKGWDGIELLSEPAESLMKYYKIEGIPRFMIFDKEGKILTVDAPRPSGPEFKSLIEQTLESNNGK